MKVAPGNVDVFRRCFEATLRVGQLAQPLRFHLGHFDDFSLGIVGDPLAYLLAVFKKTPDRILVPSFLNHSQYPVSMPSTVCLLDLMAPILVTVDAFLHRVLLANNIWPTIETIEEKCLSARTRESQERVLFTGNEQSPEFLAGRPVKKTSLTQPFYRP
jgi:hypothetical protein